MSVDVDEQLVAYGQWLCDESDRLAAAQPRHDRPRPPRSRSRRGSWVAIAAALVLLAGVSVWWFDRDTDRRIQPSVPSATTAVTTTASSPTPSTSVTTSTSTSGSTSASSDASSAAPSTTSAPLADLPFTPLVLRQPPPGYRFEWARLLERPGELAMGFVRYTAPGQPALELIVRPYADFFAEAMRLYPERWRVGEHVVVNDSESGACLPDVCSVGVQWDDHTAISVQWTGIGALALKPQHDMASLVALVGDLMEDRDAYRPGEVNSSSPYYYVTSDVATLPSFTVVLGPTINGLVRVFTPSGQPEGADHGGFDRARAQLLPDGRIVLTARDGSMPLLAPGTAAPPVPLWEGADLGGPVAVDDIAVIHGDVTLLVNRGGELATTPLDRWEPTPVGISGDLDRATLSDTGVVVCRSADGTRLLLASATGQPLPAPEAFGLDPAHPPARVAISGDGSILAWTTATSLVVAAVDDPAQRLELPLPDDVTAVTQFDVEGARTGGAWTGLAMISTGQRVWLADLATERITEWTDHPDRSNVGVITLSR